MIIKSLANVTINTLLTKSNNRLIPKLGILNFKEIFNQSFYFWQKKVSTPKAIYPNGHFQKSQLQKMSWIQAYMDSMSKKFIIFFICIFSYSIMQACYYGMTLQSKWHSSWYETSNLIAIKYVCTLSLKNRTFIAFFLSVIDWKA